VCQWRAEEFSWLTTLSIFSKQFEAQRLLNAGFTNLNVISYDQVLPRAKIIMGGSA